MYRMTGLNLLCKVGVQQIPIKPSMILHFRRSRVTSLLLDRIPMGHCASKSTREKEQTVQKLSEDIPIITVTPPSSVPTQSISNKNVSKRSSQSFVPINNIPPTCEVKCPEEDTVCKDNDFTIHFEFKVKVNGNSTGGIVSQPSDQSLATIKLCN